MRRVFVLLLVLLGVLISRAQAASDKIVLSVRGKVSLAEVTIYPDEPEKDTWRYYYQGELKENERMYRLNIPDEQLFDPGMEEIVSIKYGKQWILVARVFPDSPKYNTLGMFKFQEAVHLSIEDTMERGPEEIEALLH